MPFGLPWWSLVLLSALVGFFAAYPALRYVLSLDGGGSEGPSPKMLEWRSDAMERIRDVEAAQDRLRQETEAKLEKIRAAENRIHHKMDRLAEREEALEQAEIAEGQAAVEEQIQQNLQEGGNEVEPPEGEIADPAVVAFMARRQ